MKYLGFILFCMVFIMVYIIARAIAFSNKNIEKSRKDFLMRESKANSTRKADISNLDYLVVEPDKLPIEKALALNLVSDVEELKSLADKKIINLSAYTNTDLKFKYGPANLEALSEYDNNYTQLIRLLDNIGTAFLNAGDKSSAEAVFSYSINIGSDITSTYVSLGKLYADENRTAELKKLLNTAGEITSLSGRVIVTKLQTFLPDN